MSAQPRHIAPAALRVAIVSDAAPRRNGVGAYYADLMDHLAPHLAGIDMISPHLVGDRWQGGWSLPLPGDGTQRLCFPNPRVVKRRLTALRPDVVVIATPGPYGLAGARYARLLGADVLVGFHTDFDRLAGLYWHPALGWAVRGYFERSHRHLFRASRSVLANSDAMLAQARRLGAPATALIGTPIAHDFVHSPLTHYAGGLREVLFAGRLAPEKNLPAVLAAARACPQLRVKIAGDGPLRHEVLAAARAASNLQYLGWLDREALRAAVDATDLLVLPSHVESFGTVALEAMARGRLVLVSAACGIAQWPTLSDALYTLAPQEPLAQALSRLADQPADEHIKTAQRARAAALALNHWNLEHWLALLGARGY